MYLSPSTSTVILLSLFEVRMWSVYHCVSSIVFTLKNATVCSICSCLTCLAPYPRKRIISRPVSSQGGLCEPLFWHRFINPTSFHFFFFPSFLPSHTSTPWASRLIYSLDIWHDLSQRENLSGARSWKFIELFYFTVKGLLGFLEPQIHELQSWLLTRSRGDHS